MMIFACGTSMTEEHDNDVDVDADTDVAPMTNRPIVVHSYNTKLSIVNHVDHKLLFGKIDRQIDVTNSSSGYL